MATKKKAVAKKAAPRRRKPAVKIIEVNQNLQPEEQTQTNFSENIALTHTTTHDESEARKLEKRRENGYHGF